MYDILGRLEKMSRELHHIDIGVQQTKSGIDELKALIKQSQPHSAAGVRSVGMPPQLPHFRGRSDIVEEIACLLCSDDPMQSRVSLLATGGMGKTTVAVEVMENAIVGKKFRAANRFWVSCKGATTSTIFLQILRTSLRIKTNTEDVYSDIVNELNISIAPRLIVLDNFETPWNPVEQSEQSEVETMLCSLAKIQHVAILITMRSHVPPSCQIINWQIQRLTPLEPHASRDIYTDIDHTAAGHKALDELLDALGHMPYAIYLMATLGKESGFSPDKLLHMWREAGTGMLADEEINRSISLSVDSRLMKNHAEARYLLAILSILPAGTTRDHLDWWAPTLKAKKALAITILSRTALIVMSGETSNSTLFVYPVVQSYMEHSDHISEVCRNGVWEAAFKFILDHKSVSGDPKFKDDLKALADEDTNLQGILIAASAAAQSTLIPENTTSKKPKIDSDRLLESLVTFSRYQLWSKPRLDVAELAVALARRLPSQLHLAEALECIGQMCFQLADYDHACRALREARELFKALSKPLQAGQCGLALIESCIFGRSRDSSDAKVLVAECREIVEENGERQSYALASFTIALHVWQREPPEIVLGYLYAAQKAFESGRRSIDAAKCIKQIARCLSSTNQYSDAVETAKLAVKEFEYFGLENFANRTLLEIGWYRMMLEEHEEAQSVLECCLVGFQRCGNPLGIAQSLEFIAQIFEQRGDYGAVRLAYKRALDQYETITRTDMGRRGKLRCLFNLSQLTGKDIANAQDVAPALPLQHLMY